MRCFSVTPSISGVNATVKQALWGCDINPVKAENRLSHHCQKKTQNRNSKALSIATHRCCLHKRHAARLASSVPLCLGSTMCQYRGQSVLRHLGISYKRGRPYRRSPDVEYTQKLASVRQALEQAAQNPETHAAFYQDEFAFHRQPTIAKDWTQTGTKHPLAHQVYTIMRPVTASVPSTHTRVIWFTNKQKVRLSWHPTRFTLKSVSAILTLSIYS